MNESISVFSVKIQDNMRCFENTSGLDAEGLCKAYSECRLPFVEMARYGKEILSDYFFGMIQQDDLSFYVEFDEDCNRITVADRIFNEKPEHQGPLDVYENDYHYEDLVLSETMRRFRKKSFMSLEGQVLPINAALPDQMGHEDLKDRLIISAVNFSDNSEKLKNIPHRRVEDFAVLVQLLAGEKNQNGEYKSYLTVTKDLQDKWGISESDLFEMAKKNSERLFPIRTYALWKYAMDSAIGPSQETDPYGAFRGDLYWEQYNFGCVITNEQCFNGAATLFYEGILDVLNEYANGRDIMVLPAGVNEVYCLPVDFLEGSDKLAECREILADFLNEAGREGCLSQEVFRFDAAERVLKNVSGEKIDLMFQQDNEVKETKRYMGGR